LTLHLTHQRQSPLILEQVPITGESVLLSIFIIVHLLVYVDQVKYLDILLLSARVFKCSFDQLKMKFTYVIMPHHKACNADSEL